MPVNLKDEIKCGEGYELEFKLLPNENREKFRSGAWQGRMPVCVMA